MFNEPLDMLTLAMLLLPSCFAWLGGRRHMAIGASAAFGVAGTLWSGWVALMSMPMSIAYAVLWGWFDDAGA